MLCQPNKVGETIESWSSYTSVSPTLLHISARID